MEINIKSIPLKQLVERYGVDSAGDYWRPLADMVQVRVVDMGNPDYEFLIALHEMIEEWLCFKRKIQERDIQKFDQQFDHDGKTGEPGDDRNAPYYNEHQFATAIEKLMCNELKIKWCDYDEAVEGLFKEEEQC
jgi:hypothetical protein